MYHWRATVQDDWMGGISEFCSLPPTLSNPSLSSSGFKENKELDNGNNLPLWKTSRVEESL